MLDSAIVDYLKGFDVNIISFKDFENEYLISQGIKNIIDSKGKDYISGNEDMFERAAFDFVSDYKLDAGWGTYYGPMFVLPDENGVMMEYPSINKINIEAVEYWEKRSVEAVNPILKYRYADLVLDFGQKIKANYNFRETAGILIDSAIRICTNGYLNGIYCKEKIKRALHFAIILNDSVLIEKIKRTILDLEQRITKDDSPGIWGFSFEWFVLDSKIKDKVNLTESEQQELISELEAKMLRNTGNLNSLERSINLLAEYYSSIKDQGNLMRVLKINEESHIGSGKNDDEPLLKVNAYDRVRRVYEFYGSRGFSEAKEAEKRVQKEISQLNIDWDKSLKKISATVTIKDKEIRNYLDSVFKPKGKELTLEESLFRFTFLNLTKKDALEKNLGQEARSYPLQYIISTKILGHTDLQIATIGSIQDDPQRHLRSYASKNLQFQSIQLGWCIDEVKRLFKRDDIIRHIEASSIFSKENPKYLRKALEAFMDGHYILASHLFCPIIETGIRELIRSLGGTIHSPNSDDGYDYQTLGSFIGDGKNSQSYLINGVFQKITPDIAFYLRSALVDRLGMNLRNDFAHGFGNKEKFFERDASDRLFHIILCLSFVNIGLNKND